MVSVTDLRHLLDCNFETGELFRYSRPCFTSKNKDGYLHALIKGNRVTAHRVVWAMYHGEWPDQIDHINGIRTDNRIVNLREVTSQENAQNRRLQDNSTSGTPGVHWHKKDKAWHVRITIDRINKSDVSPTRMLAGASDMCEKGKECPNCLNTPRGGQSGPHWVAPAS